MSNYYVTVKDHGRIDILAGPFGWKLDALAMLKPATRKTIELVPFASFYAYGCTDFADVSRPGKINEHLGLQQVGSIFTR